MSKATGLIKQWVKKIALPLLSKKNYIQGILCKDNSIGISEEEATNIVRQHYKIPENPFIQKYKALSDSEIDLSIIIPVYNAEHYLDECLKSILNQETKYSYEVICVNDGSTDNSLKILHDYQSLYGDKIIIINQKNQRIAVARNTGIEAAKGRYIGFMDNDDSVSEAYVDTLLRSANLYDADIVQVGYSAKDLDGIEHVRDVKEFIVTEDPLEISKYCSGYIWSGIYRKELWNEVRFPAGYWYVDMITRILVMRLAKKFVMVDKSLYYKLIHPVNASKTLWNASNPKSIEGYYLVKYSADYGKDCLGLENNAILQQQLMYEYSVHMRQRIFNLPDNLQKALFILASSDISCRFNENSIRDNKLYDKIYKSFKKQNYNKWKFYSRALTWKSN